MPNACDTYLSVKKEEKTIAITPLTKGLSEERIQIIVEDVLPAFKPGGDTTIPVTPEAATIFVPIGGNYEFSCLNQGRV